jgi:hypothetical protein
MEDYAAFCRNRLRTCYHRRRKYPVASDGWTLAVTEARMFLGSYRTELELREINRIAQVLEINAPVGVITAEERRQWIAYWKSSCAMAETVTDEYSLSEKWRLVAAAVRQHGRRCAADRAQDIPPRPLCR